MWFFFPCLAHHGTGKELASSLEPGVVFPEHACRSLLTKFSRAWSEHGGGQTGRSANVRPLTFSFVSADSRLENEALCSRAVVYSVLPKPVGSMEAGYS